MIKYTLVCNEAHEFVSWFRSSGDFDIQSQAALIECPSCGSKQIGKAVMAPNVARRDVEKGGATGNEAETPAAAEQETPARSMALLGDDDRQMRQAFRDLRDKVIANSVDVGDRFAEEARRMHEGRSPQRSIRGETSAHEAQALWEEGIPVLPLPALPEERN